MAPQLPENLLLTDPLDWVCALLVDVTRRQGRPVAWVKRVLDDLNRMSVADIEAVRAALTERAGGNAGVGLLRELHPHVASVAFRHRVSTRRATRHWLHRRHVSMRPPHKPGSGPHVA